jgi:CDGSH-type Zn-finger protein
MLAMCVCGLSATMPYCDGSHAGTGKKPALVELLENQMVAWCGCGKSGKFPYCDGTHEKMS